MVLIRGMAPTGMALSVSVFPAAVAVCDAYGHAWPCPLSPPSWQRLALQGGMLAGRRSVLGCLWTQLPS